MDFHSLSRKELQTLCKRNKIPANMTNVAMADALKALNNVEGIEEIKKPLTSETAKSLPVSPQKTEIRSPDLSRTSRRTSARRKVNKDAVVPLENEPESSQPCMRTRGGTRRRIGLKEEQEKEETDSNGVIENDANGSNVTETPVTLNCRRRGNGGSVRQKIAGSIGEAKTYGTRRSSRLLEKMASESVQDKGGRRTEAIKINALSEEESEDLENESEEKIQENKGISDEAGGFPATADSFGMFKSEVPEENLNQDLGSEDAAAIKVRDLEPDSSLAKEICSSASAESAVEDLNGGCVNSSPLCEKKKEIIDDASGIAGPVDHQSDSSLPQEICSSANLESAVEKFSGECVHSSPPCENKKAIIDDACDITGSVDHDQIGDHNQNTWNDLNGDSCDPEVEGIQGQECRFAAQEDAAVKDFHEVLSEMEESMSIFDIESMKNEMQECLTGVEYNENNVDSEADNADQMMSDNIDPESENAGDNPSQECAVISMEQQKSDADSSGHPEDQDQMKDPAFLSDVSGSIQRKTEEDNQKSKPEEALTFISLWPKENPELLRCEQNSDELFQDLVAVADQSSEEAPRNADLEIENNFTDQSHQFEAVIDHVSDSTFAISAESEVSGSIAAAVHDISTEDAAGANDADAAAIVNPISIFEVMETRNSPLLLEGNKNFADSNDGSDFIPSSISKESEEPTKEEIAPFYTESWPVIDPEVVLEVAALDVADYDNTTEDAGTSAVAVALVDPISRFDAMETDNPLLEENQISMDSTGFSDISSILSKESEEQPGKEISPLCDDTRPEIDPEEVLDAGDNDIAAEDNTAAAIASLIPGCGVMRTSECHPLEEALISEKTFSISIEGKEPNSNMTSFSAGGPVPEIAEINLEADLDVFDHEIAAEDSVAATAASFCLIPSCEVVTATQERSPVLGTQTIDVVDNGHLSIRESNIQKPLSPGALDSILDTVVESECSYLATDHILNQVAVSAEPINDEFHTKVTPKKLSAKKSTPVHKMIPIFIDNKENMENSCRKQEHTSDLRNTKQLSTGKGSIKQNNKVKDCTLKSPNSIKKRTYKQNTSEDCTRKSPKSTSLWQPRRMPEIGNIKRNNTGKDCTLKSPRSMTQKQMAEMGKSNTGKDFTLKSPNSMKRQMLKQSKSDHSTLKSPHSPSVRQLRKMLKEKLQISESKNKMDVIKEQQEVGESRTALQPLKENCLLAGEAEN